MSDTAPLSDADFALAQRAVALGLLTREQVESAIASCDRDPGTRLVAHLSLTPDQIRSLETNRPKAAGLTGITAENACGLAAAVRRAFR